MSPNGLLSKGLVINLFEFIREFARLKQKPVYSVDSYIDVFWLDQVPKQPECFCYFWQEMSQNDFGRADDVWLTIKRPEYKEPPEAPINVRDWVDMRQWLNSELDYPELLPQILNPQWDVNAPENIPKFLKIKDFPDISKAWDDYVADKWWEWAEVDRKKTRVRECYNRLFSMHRTQLVMGEQYEYLLVAGCLHWRSSSDNAVKRHLLVLPVKLDFDPEGAVVSVVTAAGAAGGAEEVKLEHDMLSVEEQPPQHIIKEAEERCRELGDNLFHPEAKGLLTAFVQGLHPEGVFRDDISQVTGVAPEKPVVSFSPALIVRRRSQRNIIAVCESIMKDLEVGEGGLSPAIRKVVGELGVDEQRQEGEKEETVDVCSGEGEIYFPLPCNDEQKRIIERLRHQSTVLVQGPPGTGKSQTIANLICHLLATGHRILVTSQKAPALRVLKKFLDKQAPEVASLCVMVLGEGSEEQNLLRGSVGEIASRRDRWQRVVSSKKISLLREQLKELREHEARAYKNFIALREKEVFKHERVFENYSGTLAQIAVQVRRDGERFGWFRDRLPEEISLLENEAPPLPVDSQKLQELLHLLRSLDSETSRHALLRLVPLQNIPEPEKFSEMVAEENAARREFERSSHYLNHPAWESMGVADDGTLRELLLAFREFLGCWQELSTRGEEWALNAARQVLRGNAVFWQEVLQTSGNLLSQIKDKPPELLELDIQGLGEESFGAVLEGAHEFYAHLSKGGKTGFWIFRPKIVKKGLSLLKEIRVNNRPCNSVETVEKLIGWIEVMEVIRRLDEQWKSITGPVAAKWPLNQKISFYEQCQKHMEAVLKLGDLADELARRLRAISPEQVCLWHEYEEVVSFYNLIGALLNERRLNKAAGAITALEEYIGGYLYSGVSDAEKAAPENQALSKAMAGRSLEQYRQAYTELSILWQWRQKKKECDELADEIAKELPELIKSLFITYTDAVWDERLPRLQEAWKWVCADRWLAEMSAVGLDRQLAEQIRRYQKEAAATLSQLAGELAWEQCLSQLSEEDLQSLKAWQKAVGRGGKYTGKYASLDRRIAQERLEECRKAIPAWVMPFYKVLDNISVAPEIFDVVIVDEASQSGLEALILCYLAKKIVVVGDDQQIRPENAFIDRSQVYELQRRYLQKIPKWDIFSSTESFFSIAEVRFGDAIRLREHFRCMPEIIAFSNKLSYQDQPLIPLRQFGRDRLSPVLCVRYVENGYQTESRGANPPEAEQIVDTIVKCCQDPAYKGKTFGVISLLSSTPQDRLIEGLLLKKLPPEEIDARNIVCGDAYDFQGDERDVIFLSMVSAPSEKWRIGTLADEKAKRRFNVAMSRARDQVHLFHSVRADELSLKCLRRELLEYMNKPIEEGLVLSPDIPSISDLRVLAHRAERSVEKPPRPFDSWFEVDVYLDIASRGYTVIPQFESIGYYIDLVIVGGARKLAVECDGDLWHGPERFEEDLRRQRQLERCGWEFFRVRGSSYYRDPVAALAPLWEMIGDFEVKAQPAGEITKEATAEATTVPYERKFVSSENPAPGIEVWHGAKPGGSDGKHLNHNDVEETGPQIKTVEELLGQSEQQLAKIICKVLKERPHRTAKKNDIVKFVCKRYGVITRGTPRTKLERKIGRSLNRLIKEGLVEEYRSKNLRVRFIGRY